ncbi:SDR family oxidoreductase [Streptomyces sp. NPDC051597]|uniref:SDR family NAD(P)-dependent oxidoreductase n=1 Tax=Streptomyces sp. NPDC051597 TaxID=3155049 RepID=UPI003445C3B7
MDLHLSGRTALVTGASKGIGLAVVSTLLDEGARVVAVSRRTSPELEKLARPGLVHVPADLMDHDSPARVVARTVEEFGGLDVLVNNAGGPPPGVSLPRTSFLDADDPDWSAIFEFNLFSAVRTVRAALPHLLADGGGAVVTVSTALARQPSVGNAEYGAAKSALNHLTKVLSEEYAPRGVRFNTVSPGAVRTAWWTEEGGAADVIAAMAGSDRDTVMDTLAPQMMNMSTGRLVTPQEVADAVALLASPRSGSTTGADLVVDGGYLKAA